MIETPPRLLDIEAGIEGGGTHSADVVTANPLAPCRPATAWALVEEMPWWIPHEDVVLEVHLPLKREPPRKDYQCVRESQVLEGLEDIRSFHSCLISFVTRSPLREGAFLWFPLFQ